MRELQKTDALSIARRYDDPLVLVFASSQVPGGAWRDLSAHGQEESIVRTLDIGDVLETASSQLAFYKSGQRAGPLGTDESMVLSVKSRTLWFAAAPNARRLTVGTGTRDKDRLLRAVFEYRMNKLVQYFVAEGHGSLVLGAWGCGHFGNDPHMVADVMMRATEPYVFTHNVSFAVPDNGHWDAFSLAMAAAEKRLPR